ncbi:hypothetical protein QCA50_016979 [Cerrena zonata]|uniref:Uncharacterized protein n=1 Tax=Cerrena zonata TaxID=2478898 RepID=A0AAW0FED5_9APHY
MPQPDPRTIMKAYVRQFLGDNFRSIAQTDSQLPWGQPDKLLDEHGVMLIGWPIGSRFRDTSLLAMWELRELVVGVYRGNCRFEYVGKPEKEIPIVAEEAAAEPREPRRDVAHCRGRQARPAKPRRHGKTGKIFKSSPIITDEDEANL